MEAITGFLEDFDFAKLLPEIGKFMGGLRFWTGVLTVLGPAIVLVLGLWYYYRPLQEPDEKRGFRIRYAMESAKAWQYTQRLAAVVFMIAGGSMAVISILISLVCLAVSELTLMTVSVIWVLIELILVLISHRVIRRKVAAKFLNDKE